MNFRLIRTEYLASGTFGRLIPEDNSFELFTLEHSYQVQPDNIQGSLHWEPKIPLGTYDCLLGEHRLEGMTHPFQTFEVTGVPGHTNILIHPGNTEADSSGCILVGMKRFDDSILESRAAFKIFMDSLRGQFSFRLTIV